MVQIGLLLTYTAYKILPQIDDVECHAQKHPQFRNGHHALTTRSSSLWCVSAAGHNTAEPEADTQNYIRIPYLMEIEFTTTGAPKCGVHR